MKLWNSWTMKCVKCGRKSARGVHFVNSEEGLICYDCAGISLREEEKVQPVMVATEASDSWNEVITPHTFSDYIGQDTIKDELRIMLAATERHGMKIQHTLFSGSFGLGKTTLAKIFGNEIGDCAVVTAADLRGSNDLPNNPVVVIDEIHTLKEEEWLLTFMDRGEKVILGATTTAGSLSGPLRSRFVSLVLEPYKVPELKVMVKGAARNLEYDCPDFVAEEVAKRGKTVARTTLFLFKRVYDRIILNGGSVDKKTLLKWFEIMKIDKDGLDNADRAYIKCLSDRPIGLQNLSAMTGLDKITIEETIEPYLLGQGYVMRTPRGRVIGNKKAAGVWK